MDRLAVFVEGYTAVVFVEKLIEELAGKNKVLIEHREIRGGSTTRRTMGLIKAAKPDTGQKYYVLLVDCGGDKQVKTRIMEEHENLTKKGYSKIIGLRDVRPDFTYAEIPRLESNLPKYVKTKLTPVEFILRSCQIVWKRASDSNLLLDDDCLFRSTLPATPWPLASLWCQSLR